MGLGSAVVQYPEMNPRIAGQVFGLLLIVNGVIFLSLWLTSGWIAGFFNEARLAPVIQALAGQFLLGSLGVIPGAVLARRMDFRRKSWVELLRTVIAAGLTLLLAWLGYGVWALVGGNLANTLVTVIGLNWMAHYRYRPSFAFGGLRRVVHFGGFITLERLFSFLYSQSDVLIIGKLLGKETLGVYSVAMDLASLPMQKSMGLLNEVGFAAFARVQHDPRRVADHLGKVLRVMSFLIFPVFFGITAVAPEIVQVFLGLRWQSVELPLQLLSAVIPLRMLSSLMVPALQGIGRSDINVGNVLIACAIMPVAFLLGSRWGLPGVALAWVMAYPVVFLITLGRVLPVLHIDARNFWRWIRAPLFTSLVMGAAVVLLRNLPAIRSLPPPLLLLLLVTTGAGVYLSMALAFYPQTCRELGALLRG
jgi:O-antigen/teichoic acid export membrane protein